MRRVPAIWGSGLLVALALAPRPAHAQEHESTWTPHPNERPHDWELAGRASYAAPPVRGGTSPFGGGFGGRLGVSAANVYFGVAVIDYLGETDVDVWSHALLYGGEVGYGFRLAELGGGTFLVLRPQMGVGGVTVFHTTPNATSGSSNSGTVKTRANVDVVTTASGGTSSASSGSSSSSSSTTTTVSNLYVQPGVTLLLSSATTFAGVNGNMLVMPGLTYGGNDATTWISYGLEGQLGVRF